MSDHQGERPEALAALRASDPVLARLIDSLEPVDFTSWRARWSLDSFRALARAIVGQQIATRAAAAIFDRLRSLIGHRDPATAIAEASDAELRSVGLSAAKTASLRDLAARTLGRADILPAGDLGIRHAVKAAYGLDHVPTEGEVRVLSEAWRPNRSLATAYLYSSLRGTAPGRPAR